MLPSTLHEIGGLKQQTIAFKPQDEVQTWGLIFLNEGFLIGRRWGAASERVLLPASIMKPALCNN